ncbi:hypothetical protein F8388_001344 [Cannabis sativa]|uniref:Uncharacterized protein n=1 Tax=Cannabis sativa TaxID=3483 RepID=A0A7J6DY76_CANSA|nr:hypothetical protein F8388_001344 [Cannabis sativa]KAF4366099.1 hypothetical protein G4B88_000691 [Cannabis sativa]
MQARVLAVTMQARVQVVGSTVQARAGRRCKHRYGGAISIDRWKICINGAEKWLGSSVIVLVLGFKLRINVIGSKDKEEDQRKLKNLPELKKTIGGSDRC